MQIKQAEKMSDMNDAHKQRNMNDMMNIQEASFKKNVKSSYKEELDKQLA